MNLKIFLLSDDAKMPVYAHEGDAGMDLFASESKEIVPGDYQAIGTGIAIKLPSGTEGQVRSKSGLAINHGITVLNSPGTIDQGYQGEIKVLLHNKSRKPYKIKKGQKIAQLVICPFFSVDIEVDRQDPADETTRGSGGFGSTGLY